MCRIYGYFHTTASPSEVRTVAALQRHGGPDSTGTARAAGWGVGNNRLAIVDLDGGQQPYDLDGRIKAVFNGEIYNHDALRARLRQRGYDFPDRCDGNVIPALYAEYGERFPEELDGMYSVAVLDRRGSPTLVLATDHAGMKPLYYRWDAAGRSLHFSSEIPALLGFRGARTRAWEPGLDAYLATKTPFGERTMFEDVRVLPPATTMTVPWGEAPRVVHRTADRGELHHLGDTGPGGASNASAPVPGAPGDETAAAAAVRRNLGSEVERLLTADVPVAVVTSGGLDSSLVTALAARSGPVHSFNIAYRGSWPFDERRFAELAAREAGTVHHQVEIDPAAFPSMVEDVVWHLGQPNADPITLSTYALFDAIRTAGFKVALTGDAADEVFGGYARMRAAAQAADAGRDWLSGYLDALAVVPARLRHGLYTEEYRGFLRGRSPLPEEALGSLRDGPGSVLERITRFELDFRLPAYHLRRVDHLSMASSVEARLPFCQRSIVGPGRRLPDALRISGGRVKRTLYGAAAGLVPQPLLDRPKQPFTLPITAMLGPGRPLWEYARDVLHSKRLADAGQLDPEAVGRLFVQQAERPDDTAALTLWALLIHQVWREQFQSEAPHSPLTAVAA
ncbi:asparagine synthase (glutamine-hydrolyzing) [Streptomyces spirodelae]|uniref:asparagine synthase (glutamine-hydrolyzing) n=1 Tax=Streptomyces spirodelae TaxID=2812904 RepID=A0ABS3WRW6_9ACTN|nr:asparagine synthase (glutamine-hydrolyzing) [Streptomyces spirodelae]MBO8185861.1 asparagine synthase (glutamine-hydrolyzing) [Streptomyces spirodelae]